MKKTLITVIALLLAAGVCNVCFADGVKIQTINVQANIASLAGGLDVVISKVIPANCTGLNDTNWTTDTAINFTTLTFDSVNKIFRAPHYYAVDVGVLDNSSTVWTITHTKTSFKRVAGTETLDGNTNVSFSRVYLDSNNVKHYTDLSKVSYANSNSVQYTKTQLQEAGYQGWLRVYYGIATGNLTGNAGNCVPDNTGVTPITISKPSGQYSGTVTLTLTP